MSNAAMKNVWKINKMIDIQNGIIIIMILKIELRLQNFYIIFCVHQITYN